MYKIKDNMNTLWTMPESRISNIKETIAKMERTIVEEGYNISDGEDPNNSTVGVHFQPRNIDTSWRGVRRTIKAQKELKCLQKE